MMSLDRLINILVTITLIEMMVLIGLRVKFADIVSTSRNWTLVARAAVANYLLVPSLTVVLLLLFGVNAMVTAGFLVLAVCPGAPYGPPFAGIARADVPEILAASSAILSPLLLRVLLPWAADGEAPQIDPFGIVGVLLITQLLPLMVGLVTRHWRPQLAERLIGPFALAGTILNLSVMGLILATQFHMLSEIRVRGFVGMLMLLAGSLIIGWLAGTPSRDNRKTMALTTSLRNVGLGLVIVTGNLAGTQAVSATLAYGIVEVLGALLVALVWRSLDVVPNLSSPAKKG